MTKVTLGAGAWYGDAEVDLDFPADWDVETYWPHTPPPLTAAEIEDRIRRPVGQPRLRELAIGKTRPIIILDDTTRPTPTAAVLQCLLRELAAAGIAAADVRVILATGTHGAIPAGAAEKKLGAALGQCRLVFHDDRRNVVRVGTTSCGTPVFVNSEVAASDLVLGVGGVYPQHSTGFGGGAKLALGVLGRRSIMGLHYGHPSMEGVYSVDNDFRRDLDEVAECIGLRTVVAVHVDGRRQIVSVTSGSPQAYYADAVAFSRSVYQAPLPGSADIVVSNAYPIDVSLTFMRSKGLIPLLRAKPGSSRVILASCPEGAGHHGLFPFVGVNRFRPLVEARRRAIVAPERIPKALAKRSRRVLRRPVELARGRLDGSNRTTEAPAPASDAPALAAVPAARPIWLYRGLAGPPLPADIPGMTAIGDWADVVATLRHEQGDVPGLRVAVYPCAPLQVLAAEPIDAAAVSSGPVPPAAA